MRATAAEDHIFPMPAHDGAEDRPSARPSAPTPRTSTRCWAWRTASRRSTATRRAALSTSTGSSPRPRSSRPGWPRSTRHRGPRGAARRPGPTTPSAWPRATPGEAAARPGGGGPRAREPERTTHGRGPRPAGDRRDRRRPSACAAAHPRGRHALRRRHRLYESCGWNRVGVVTIGFDDEPDLDRYVYVGPAAVSVSVSVSEDAVGLTRR